MQIHVCIGKCCDWSVRLSLTWLWVNPGFWGQSLEGRWPSVTTVGSAKSSSPGRPPHTDTRWPRNDPKHARTQHAIKLERDTVNIRQIGWKKDILNQLNAHRQTEYTPVCVGERRIHWESPWAGRFWEYWHIRPHVSLSELGVYCSFLRISAFPSTDRSTPQTTARGE